MTSEQIMLGLLAVGIGSVLIVLAFVPFVAVSYRRYGRLPLVRSLLWAAALVYAVGVWAFTLLPLPDPATITCAASNVHPFAFRTGLAEGVRDSGGSVLGIIRNPTVMQVVLNVVLFMPLGAFMRLLAGRGFGIAVLAGLAGSLLIETTQLTGVWGLYPCAFRVADVDDLILNTGGSALGWILALLLPHVRSVVAHTRRSPRTDPSHAAGPVTRRRRLLGMACDGVAYALLTMTVGVAVQIGLLYGPWDADRWADGGIASAVGTAGAAGLWLLVTMGTGSTIGDLSVRIRFEGDGRWEAGARVLRFLLGIGGFALLDLAPLDLGPVWFSALPALYALVLVGFALFTAGGRGLPGLATRRRPVALPPAR